MLSSMYLEYAHPCIHILQNLLVLDVIMEKFADMNEVSSIFPNQYRELHTTKSWEFIGLTPNSRRNIKLERNVIVGLLDTGETKQKTQINRI